MYIRRLLNKFLIMYSCNKYQYQLFLGLKTKSGDNIDKKCIECFIDNKVLPYCNNFTITKNIGYYNGKKEGSLTLTILTEDYSIYNKIKNIGYEYKKDFDQESVLLSCNTLLENELINL